MSNQAPPPTYAYTTQKTYKKRDATLACVDGPEKNKGDKRIIILLAKSIRK